MAPEPDLELIIEPGLKAEIESKLGKIGLDTKPPKFELESFMRWAEIPTEDARYSLDALVNANYHCNNFWAVADAVRKVSKSVPENYIKVFKKLEEKLGYSGLNAKSSIHDVQINHTTHIASMGEKALDAIDLLAETGYTLTTWEGEKFLSEGDAKAISGLMNTDLTKYFEMFKKIKESSGYKGEFNYKAGHAEDILVLSNMEGDVFGVIDVLIKSGCNPRFYDNGVLPRANLIQKIANKGADNYLAVLTKLQQQLGYRPFDKHSNPDSELDKIMQIMSVDSDVLKILDALAETNYKIHHFFNHPNAGDLTHYEIGLIQNLAKSDLDKFVKCYRFLKDRFGVSTTNEATASSILRLSQLGDETFNTLDKLADSGYALEKIGGNKWVTHEDVDLLRKLSKPKNLETFLQNLYKLKEILNYTIATTGKDGKKMLIDFIKRDYLASHAQEILKLSDLKGDVWGAIGALVKSGYEIKFSNKKLFDKPYLLERLAKCDTEKYSDIFNKLKERFKYKTINICSSGNEDQVEHIIEISKFKGDVCRAIEVLSESGYTLDNFGNKAWMRYTNKQTIQAVAELGPQNYIHVFRKLKEKLGYKTVNLDTRAALKEKPDDQVRKIIEIAKIPGHVLKFIDLFSGWRNLDVNAFGKDNSLHAGGLLEDGKKVDKLPPWGNMDLPHDMKPYKIDKKKGITYKDVEIIRYIANTQWEESLKSLTPCFYREPDSDLFMNCFESLSTEEKKAALKGVFHCDKTVGKKIIEWLDKNYPELVREVGLRMI